MPSPFLTRVRNSVRCLFAATIALLIAIPAYAQESTGSIFGQVSDASGAIVDSATVQLENTGTHEVRRLTISHGEFAFTTLKIGTYSLDISAAGFQTHKVSGFPVLSGDARRLDVVLQVQGSTQTVEVTSEPALLKTDSSSIDVAVPGKTIEDLPSNGRNLIVLAQDLVPGATAGNPGNILSGQKPDDRRQSSSISVNGQPVTANDFLIDGLDNNERYIGIIGVRPSIDGVAELHVQTNLYTADVGRTAGGVINVITKSGTNSFHGSAFEYIRNDVLNASDYFALTRPRLRQNQFGGSLGGPIVKNKTFFFADYEGLRIINGATSTSLVPSLYEEQHPGDLTDIGGPVIAASQLNPIALNYFKLYPAPNRAGNLFTYSGNGTQFGETADTRVDQHINERNLFFARYTINQTDTFTAPALPAVGDINPVGNPNSYPGTTAERQQNIQLNYIHFFTDKLLLEAKAGYTRINEFATPLNFGKNYSTQLGLVNANLSLNSSALTPMLVGPYASLGEGNYEPIVDIDNTYQYSGTLSWSHGDHTVRAGGILIRRQFNNFESSQGVGQYTFSGTNLVTLENFLTGNAAQYVRSNQLFSNSYRSWEPSGYIQDDWHAGRRLTLNLGLRYGSITPFTEHHNQLSNFNPTADKLIVAGVGGVSRTAGVKVDYSNVAPRLGFALQAYPNTVVRGGFGISYFPMASGSHMNLQNAPFTFNYGPVYNVSISAPAPIPVSSDPNAPFGTIAGALNLNYRNNQMYQTSLELAQSVRANILSVRYIGDFGRRLSQIFGNIDVPAPSTTTTSANLQQRRPYYSELPNVTAIQEVYSEGSSSYNALQFEVARRTTNGLSINANYTFAHELDNLSVSSLLPTQSSTYDYGNSSLDFRHKLGGGVTYLIPAWHSSTGFLRAATSEWQINAVGRWQTGIPFTVSNGAPQINAGVSSDRPNQIGNPYLPHPSISRFFNASAFAPQPFGTPGNVHVNSLHGPHQRSVDVSLMKYVPLRESLRLQLRAETFNVTNTPSFSVPNSNISSSTVGTITSTNGIARQLQFAARLIF
jgi:hypothetical protein